MSQEIENDKFKIHRNLNWIIPALVTAVLVIYHLMYAVKTVEKLEKKITDHLMRIRKIEDHLEVIDKKYKVKTVEIDSNIEKIEEFCCGEKIRFKEQLKKEKY